MKRYEFGKDRIKCKTKQEQKEQNRYNVIRLWLSKTSKNTYTTNKYKKYIYNLAVLSNSEFINPSNSCLYLQTEMTLEKLSHHYVLNRHFLIYVAENCLHHGKSNGTHPVGKSPDF